MKIFTINAGVFRCDGGAMFGVVPKRVWSRRYPCNDDNFCQMVMRCLLIDTGERLILVDTGCGTKQSAYFKYYGIGEVVSFDDELQHLGYATDDVTDVVLTHLHFDHCGGCTYYDGDELRLTFPNATHWVGAEQWANFLAPNVREGDSYFSENMLPVEAAGRLCLVSEDVQICEQVELQVYHGHTRGQLVPFVSGDCESERLVFAGDVIPMAASVPIAWVSAYDTDPIRSMQEKELLLSEVVRGDFWLYFEHDAYTEKAKVKAVNGKYRILG